MGIKYLYDTYSYQDMIDKFYKKDKDNDNDFLTLEVTFQITEDCNLNCSYCYQKNKTPKKMNFETAKIIVDNILDDDSILNKYTDLKKYVAVSLEFIGGEPLLEIELIQKICEYFIEQAIAKHHRFALNFMINMTSNGLLYFKPEVQEFLNKYGSHVYISISLDGTKELHDKCRLTKNGEPTYDRALLAAKDLLKRYGPEAGTKITIAPDNVQYLYAGVRNMYELGYRNINANCVYEAGWTLEHAKEYYYQLKQIADWFLEDNILGECKFSLFDENNYTFDSDDKNWCGGDGKMLAFNPEGEVFPCLRYMESSIGNDQPPYSLGNIKTDICSTEIEKERLKCLKCITKSSQSEEKCITCPIAKGCGWCSAYNYQVNGTPNKRVTYICDMHKAASLANVYLWNRFYKLKNIKQVFPMNCPKEWALEIIDEDEYNMLVELTKR